MRWALLMAMAAATQQPWPSHARTPEPAAKVVATVNGTALLADRLESAVQALVPFESFHRNVSAEKMAALRRRALDQIVDDELEYQDAVARGLSVAETAVDGGMREVAARYPDRKAFLDALARAGVTEADMRREVRRALMIRSAYQQRITSQCAVGTAEAQRYFAAHPERFVEPERLRVQAITIGVDPGGGVPAWTAGKAKAEEVRAQLEAGAAFDVLARKYSSDPSADTGGDMGLVHRGSLNPAFEQVAATLPVGEVSPVVETIYGYHLIRVVEVLPPRPRTFEDVGARLQQDLTDERCTAAKDAWVAGLRAAARIGYPE